MAETLKLTGTTRKLYVTEYHKYRDHLLSRLHRRIIFRSGASQSRTKWHRDGVARLATPLAAGGLRHANFGDILSCS